MKYKVSTEDLAYLAANTGLDQSYVPQILLAIAERIEAAAERLEELAAVAERIERGR